MTAFAFLLAIALYRIAGTLYFKLLKIFKMLLIIKKI